MITREQVLEAAIQVFGQTGYSKTTIQDVATAAKVGKGTIYMFFESKSEILFEACKLAIYECQQQLLKQVDGAVGDSKEIMESLIRFFLLEIIPDQSKSCFLFYELLVLSATDLTYQKKISELLTLRQIQTEGVFLGIYEMGLSQGVFKKLEYAREFFRSFLASIDGLIYQHSFNPDVLNLEQQVESEMTKIKEVLYKEVEYA